jgi:hypothetical protein
MPLDNNINMTTTQGLMYTSNYTLNTKGADAWVSTLNPLIDLFATGMKKCPDFLEEFENIFNIVSSALREDPECFIKVLKFHRLISNGNGIRWIYYLCMLIIKMENPDVYQKILDWSWQYPKDFMNLHRITNMYFPINSSSFVQIQMPHKKHSKGSYASKLNAWVLQNEVKSYGATNVNVRVQIEIVMYANIVSKLFTNLLTPDFDSGYNPMFLKYMSYESGHWEVETHLIWECIENSLKDNIDFIELVKSDLELRNELGIELRNILKQSLINPNGSSKLFTNKTRRLVKKCFNSHINLTDNLFKGIHQDGSIFGSHSSKFEEIELIAGQLKHTSTLAFDRFEKTIKKYQSDEPEKNQTSNLTHSYLLEGYSKYLELLKLGKAQVKTTGLVMTKQVWDFFQSNETFSQSIELKLVDMADKLKISLIKTSGTCLFNQLAQRFSLVLDISGSMRDVPIQTGLLYMLLMARVFRIKQLFYFGSKLHIVNLVDADFNGTFCNLIKKIYKNVCGSTTNLKVIFEHFKSNNIRDKNVIIITDGDCDPSSHSKSNPFHTAPKESHGLKYVVVNVKETKMNFPYIGMDQSVCYVTGNNPKTLNGLIKALVLAMITNQPITPTLVLKCSLDLEELENTFEVGTYSKVYNHSEIENIFQVFMKNRPTFKSNSYNDLNLHSDSDYDSNYDFNSDSKYYA